MKKITSTVVLVLLAAVMYAQDLQFGVSAGPNLSTARLIPKSDYEQQPEFVVGFQIGAFAEWSLTNNISIRPELNYHTLGYKFPSGEGLYGYRHKSGYITPAIMVKYSIAEKLKIGLGPYVSAKVVAKSKRIPTSDGDIENEEEGWFDYTDEDNDEYSGFDYGLGAGISYQFLPKLGVALGYNHGLSNIFKSEYTDGAKAQNRYFTLGFSYSIR